MSRRARARHYDTLRRVHHSFLTRCIGWRKHTRTDHPIFYLETLVKTGSESIEELKADPVRGVCGAHGGHETAEARDVRELVGGAVSAGGKRKNGWGVSWTTSEFSASNSTSGRSQPRTTGDGIGRQNKGRRSHDEMDRGRESQGSITACRIIPKRDGKDQEEGSLKQACSYWFARSSWLATVARTMRFDVSIALSVSHRGFVIDFVGFCRSLLVCCR